MADSFRILLDRDGPTRTEEPPVMAWCPTMDLIAMSLPATRNVVVHRLSWQRLFVIQHKADVCAISWRPDGRALAVGLSSGMVYVYDVENGAPLASFASHSTALRCMRWAGEDCLADLEDASDDDMPVEYADQTSRFIPSIGHLVKQPSGKPDPFVPKLPLPTIGGTMISSDKAPTIGSLLNLLVSIDKSGTACLSASGVMPVARLDLGMLAGIEKPRILHISMSLDLHRLTAVLERDVVDALPSPSGSRPGHIAELRLVVVGTDLIWKRRREIQKIASLAQNIAQLLTLLHSAVAAAAEQWKQSTEQLHMKMDSLLSVIREEHKLNSSVPEELLGLIATGIPSPPLRDFLTQQMSEQRLKMMEKKMDAGMKAVQELLLQNIRPASECLAYRLAELNGLSLWKSRFDNIGIDSSAVGRLSAVAKELVFRVETALHAFIETRSNIRTFFTWICRVASLVAEDGAVRNLGSGKGTPTAADVAQVVNFLENGFMSHDPFADSFRTSGNLSAFSPTKAGGQPFNSPPKAVGAAAGFRSPASSNSVGSLPVSQCANLSQALQSLITQWEIFCRQPSEAISRSCSLLANVLLVTEAVYDKLKEVPTSKNASDMGTVGSPGRPKRQGTASGSDADGQPSMIWRPQSLALHVSSPKDADDHTPLQYVAFSRQKEPGSQQIHVLRFPSRGGVQIEGTSVSMSQDITQVEFYNERQLAVLLGASDGHTLGLIDFEDLPYAFVWDTASQGTASVSDRLDALGSEQDLSLSKRRLFPHSNLQQMALSGSRGVACLLAMPRRLLVLDLEDDEAAELLP